MLAFVDESGDPGLKLGAGSSPYFVITVVIFEDHHEAQNADDRIALFRQEMGLHPRFEFRFNRCNRDYCTRFLRVVAPYEFSYHGIVINKAKLTGPGFRVKESFYKYATGLVFENAKLLLRDADVLIDGSGSRDFERQLQKYLKNRINDDLNQRFIREVKVQSSTKNNLLQLADMVVGALGRSFSQKTDANSYRSIVRHREVRVQVWPI